MSSKSLGYRPILLLVCSSAAFTSFRSAVGRAQRRVRVLDVTRVKADQPASSAVLGLDLPAHPEEISCDILVVGASTGGVAGALAAARGGHSVCLTEETAWIGGQMTAQGVSAFDENKYIETTAGTAFYRKLRDGIRRYYTQHYRLRVGAVREPPLPKPLNPGDCWVSALCFEPEAALEVLGSMLQPYRKPRFGIREGLGKEPAVLIGGLARGPNPETRLYGFSCAPKPFRPRPPSSVSPPC